MVLHSSLAMSYMSGEARAFLDTNILIYAFQDRDAAKRAAARQLIERGFRELCFSISTQVLLEFYVNVTRKSDPGMEPGEALTFLHSLEIWPVEPMTSEAVITAAALSQKAQISLWDAAILTAARRAGCTVVLSEDLNSGQVYDGVIVRNPFTAS